MVLIQFASLWKYIIYSSLVFLFEITKTEMYDIRYYLFIVIDNLSFKKTSII